MACCVCSIMITVAYASLIPEALVLSTGPNVGIRSQCSALM